MNNKLAIFGYGGHSKVIIDIAINNKFNEIDIYDDNKKLPSVVGNLDDLIQSKDNYGSYFVAIGKNDIRMKIYKKIKKTGLKPVSLVHPSANISTNVVIGKGVCVMAGCSINSNTNIYDGSIINTNSSIDHDCNIGEFSHICPGVNIAGSVNIGELVFIGIGSNIVNNLNISSETRIKAGTTVIKSI